MEKKELEDAIANAKRVLELSEQRPVSTMMTVEIKRQFGADWEKYPELKAHVAKQIELEDRAIKFRKRDLRKLETQLKGRK